MKRNFDRAADRTLFATLILTVIATAGAHAQIFNAEAGYTDSVTPAAGSPWSYGDKATPTSTTTIDFDTSYVYPAAPPNGIEGLGDYGTPPSIEAGNDSRIQVNPASAAYMNFPADTITLEGDDTGAAHPDSFIRFTAGNGVANTTGLFNLSLSFTSLGGNDFTDYLVYTSAATGTPVILFTTTPTDLSIALSTPLDLSAGDTLDVVQSGDTVVRVDETLTSVPEPATWACLLGGLVLLAGGTRALRVLPRDP
jgi:hypothetical protein